MKEFYNELGYTSATLASLSNEARADVILAPPPTYEESISRPLRLLSCGSSSFGYRVYPRL